MLRKPALAALLAFLALAALPAGASATFPLTTIASGPSGTVGEDTATFAFASPLPARFQCRLDEEGWRWCRSPKTYGGLADGPHLFMVRSLVWGWFPDPNPAIGFFVVDTYVPDPPETTLVSGPSGTIATGAATFAFESDQPGGFECRLDSEAEADWAPCESPQSYGELAEGEHGFEVRAVNEAGEPDPTPALAPFTVELPLPPPPAPVTAAAPGPEPEAGRSFVLGPAEGTVELQCPGEDGSQPLTSFKEVPMGCLVNTRHGVVSLTASQGTSGNLQSAHFWGGVIVITQKEGDDQKVEVKLAGKRMCERRGAKRKGAARASGRRGGGRRAWGSGKGNYETSGSYGSATVRGTTWLVVDRCDASTLFRVAEGTVWVDDFVKDRQLVLEAGEQYVAKAPIPRLNPDKFP